MDNHHVLISESRISSGILELSGLTADPKEILYAVATHLYHPSRGTPAAILIWSGLVRFDSKGSALAQEIRMQLPHTGNLWVIHNIKNPKTGNMISLWSYVIPHEAFREWYKKECSERAKHEVIKPKPGDTIRIINHFSEYNNTLATFHGYCKRGLRHAIIEDEGGWIRVVNRGCLGDPSVSSNK